MRVFGKNYKNRRRAWGSDPEPLLLPEAKGSETPGVVTLAYCYNSVEFVSIAKCAFIAIEKEQNNYSKCSAFASSRLLHLFFNSNSIVFVGGENRNISYPRTQVTL